MTNPFRYCVIVFSTNPGDQPLINRVCGPFNSVQLEEFCRDKEKNGISYIAMVLTRE